MRVKILDEGDISWLFLDVENAHHDARLASFVLEGVSLDEAQDEDHTVWLQNGDEYRVVPREGFDFDAPNEEWFLVPIPVFVLDLDEWQREQARHQ